jgi:hypothetical protein
VFGTSELEWSGSYHLSSPHSWGASLVATQVRFTRVPLHLCRTLSGQRVGASCSKTYVYLIYTYLFSPLIICFFVLTYLTPSHSILHLSLELSSTAYDSEVPLNTRLGIVFKFRYQHQATTFLLGLGAIIYLRSNSS